MGTGHIARKREIFGISDEEFIKKLISRCTLSPIDKQIATMVYLQEEKLDHIAYVLNFDKSTVGRRLKRITTKLFDLKNRLNNNEGDE